MATLAWFDQHSFLMNRHTYKLIKYEMLPYDIEHEGLIGFRVTKTQPSPLRTEVFVYWLDPAKDYIIIKGSRYNSDCNYYWDSTRITKTLETKQTADGQWYPSRQVYSWEYSNKDGKHKEQTDKRIQISTNTIIRDEVFDVNDL